MYCKLNVTQGAVILFLNGGSKKVKPPHFFNIKLIFIMANLLKVTTVDCVKNTKEINALKKVIINVDLIEYEITLHPETQQLIITKNTPYKDDEFPQLEGDSIYENIIAIK